MARHAVVSNMGELPYWGPYWKGILLFGACEVVGHNARMATPTIK